MLIWAKTALKQNKAYLGWYLNLYLILTEFNYVLKIVVAHKESKEVLIFIVSIDSWSLWNDHKKDI